MIVCFDLDGTLINTQKWIMPSLKEAFNKNGIKVTKKNMLDNWGSSVPRMIRKVYPFLSEKEVKKITRDYLRIRKKRVSQVNPFKDTFSTLNYFKKKGFKLVLVSNNSKSDILMLLKQAKINKKMFSAIIGEDQVKRPKPFPDELLKVQKKLRKKVMCFVGDTFQDIQAAKSAKVISILVKTGPRSSSLAKIKPDFTIKTLKDLIPLIEDKIYQQE